MPISRRSFLDLELEAKAMAVQIDSAQTALDGLNLAGAPVRKPDTQPAGVPAADLAPVRVGVIGYGYWGPNIVRNFVEARGAQVTMVSDRRPQRLAQVQQRYSCATVTTDCNEVFQDPNIDAVAIITPVSTHFDLAMEALKAGKHVLVTKPMTATSEQAIQLIEKADEVGRVLMVDHTFLYTGAVRKIKELVDTGALGRLYYFDSTRVNLGLFQHDVNVLWDLAVHDLSIMDYVIGQTPIAVAASGMAHVPGQPVNMAYLTCYFENNVLAHHHVNWLAPVKVRRTLIGGDRRMIVYDDLEPSEKVKVYDKGITVAEASTEQVYESLVGYRTGDMWAPQVSLTEGLLTEAEHFVDCVRQGRRPLTDGHAGLRLLRILEAATKSLALRGQPVEIN
jgi:predicted dehydrogenase